MDVGGSGWGRRILAGQRSRVALCDGRNGIHAASTRGAFREGARRTGSPGAGWLPGIVRGLCHRAGPSGRRNPRTDARPGKAGSDGGGDGAKCGSHAARESDSGRGHGVATGRELLLGGVSGSDQFHPQSHSAVACLESAVGGASPLWPAGFGAGCGRIPSVDWCGDRKSRERCAGGPTRQAGADGDSCNPVGSG